LAFFKIFPIRTINHPADLNEVLAVGGIDAGGVMVAGYSSRGMTNSELASGMGRVKPDIVTSSKFIVSKIFPLQKNFLLTISFHFISSPF